QADCVMLSGETTTGKYPIECVEAINRIAHRTEREQNEVLRQDLELRLPRSMMLRSAAQLAADMQATAILVFTRRGIFSQKLSSLRPLVPIYAFTDNPVLFKQMLIMRGIEPFYMKFDHDHEATIQDAFSLLKNRDWAKTGDPIVVVTKLYAGKKLIDSTQIRTIE
ncbi:MAG: pyruvate kinase, partial [Puniceicoccaceae bacterium]|nr:pyruvate kinase [Puniceicoccaceae bacterium]